MGSVSDKEKDASPIFFERTWPLVASLGIGALTLVFLMALVIMSMDGNPPPESIKYIVITIIALGLSFSTAFLGGRAAIKGSIPFIPEGKPAEFSMVGGVAVFLIVFIAASKIYPTDPVIKTIWNGYLSSLKYGVAKISNVDDTMIVKVNGQILSEVKYGSSSSFDIKDKLKVGENIIGVEIFNTAYGGCSGALQLVFNDYEENRYKYKWKNNFAAANTVCYSDIIKLPVK